MRNHSVPYAGVVIVANNMVTTYTDINEMFELLINNASLDQLLRAMVAQVDAFVGNHDAIEKLKAIAERIVAESVAAALDVDMAEPLSKLDRVKNLNASTTSNQYYRKLLDEVKIVRPDGVVYQPPGDCTITIGIGAWPKP